MATYHNPDVVVSNEGTLVTFMVCTDTARDWFGENVESDGWQWLGNRLGVEWRCADMLADGLVAEGFNVVFA